MRGNRQHTKVRSRFGLSAWRHSRILFGVTVGVVVGVISSGSFNGIFIASQAAEAASASISVWWPTNGAHVSGEQPLKAVVEGRGVESYELYWSVDAGQNVELQNNYQDYPHKEIAIDFSGWTWRGGGPYMLTLTAKDASGIIGSQNISIYIDNGLPAEAAPAQAVSSSTATEIILAASSEQLALAAPESARVDVWWPVPQASLFGTLPLKAVVPGRELAAYRMYWQVDGGALNEMADSAVDAPHKESTIDVSGWHWQSSGSYRFTFIAKDLNGTVIASADVPVYINAPQSASQPVASIAPQPASAKKTSSAVLYVDPNSPAAAQAASWRSSRPNDAAMMDVLAAQPTAFWFGEWSGNIHDAVQGVVSRSAAAGAVPVLVAYNIPGRDCGSYSAGGSSSSSAYLSWISSFASGIGGNTAIVILEPDGIASIGCLSQDAQKGRLSTLSQAVDILKQNQNTRVYIDAGHPGWIDADTMSKQLAQANVARADGFALNVSNFDTTAANISYGSDIAAKLNGLIGKPVHFVIDTSRNGNGSNGEWCNPAGRAIGVKPTLSTGSASVDAFLWIKRPGESDGNCNGGPSAGTWWPDYARSLVANAR